MDKEFEKGAEQFKKDIKSGKIKVTPDLIGRFAQIFAIPKLKLRKWSLEPIIFSPPPKPYPFIVLSSLTMVLFAETCTSIIGCVFKAFS